MNIQFSQYLGQSEENFDNNLGSFFKKRDSDHVLLSGAFEAFIFDFLRSISSHLPTEVCKYSIKNLLDYEFSLFERLTIFLRLRNPLLSNIIIYASEFHQKFKVKRFVPGIQKKLQAESAAHVIKCVFEIRHFKQRIPGLIGATCG